ncbi:MAG TPA: M20/M25/M40 family metallo-hydrolase, partial [Thermoleophilia bacterium]|nr:M20/M25/M40 family metallo-hydrolase [Thermoleophilia bacterium]
MKTTVGGHATADYAAAARRIVAELEGMERERLAFSPADMRGRVHAASLMSKAGFAVRIDDAFNVLGRREDGAASGPGAEPPRPILMGGHLDTVSNPGRFDGPLGLLCGLECARFIGESGIPLRHPLAVAGFSDEEGTATDCCWGSRALLGRLSEVERRKLADKTSPLGATMVAAAAELGRLGWEVQPARLATETAASLTPAAYLELHIHQGPGLIVADAAVAAVSG